MSGVISTGTRLEATRCCYATGLFHDLHGNGQAPINANSMVHSRWEYNCSSSGRSNSSLDTALALFLEQHIAPQKYVHVHHINPHLSLEHSRTIGFYLEDVS